jgi:cytochrome P450
MADSSCPIASIGERFNPLAGAQLEDPYPFYEQARRDEPVFFSPAFRMWVVTSYAEARAVLANPTLFSSKDSINPIVDICPEALAVLGTGVPMTPSVINSDPPDHGRWRRALNAAFSASRMRQLEPQISEITHARIDAIEPFGRCDVVGDIAYPIPLQVITRLCDVGDEYFDELKVWSQNFMAFISSVLEPDRQVEAAKDVVAFQLFLRDHIARKRADPGEDITSTLISGGGDAPFSDDELVTQLVNVLIAGHESTVHMIGNGLYALLRDPARWAEVVADRSLIPAAVEETLRIDSSVPTFMRTATQHTEIAGRTIAPGDTVLVVFGAANHDGQYFSDPERFDLGRPAKPTHMGFGHGIHSCVGAPLARVEGRVVFDALASRLPNLRLTPEQEFGHVPTLIFRGLSRLDVEWG